MAIIEDGRLADLFVERMWERQKAGEIYKARVESVLPGIHASFVNLGDGENAFLYLNDARGARSPTEQRASRPGDKDRQEEQGSACVTSRISLPGRYVVLVPGGQESGVSKRIVDENERKRLKAIARELRGDYGDYRSGQQRKGVDDESLAHGRGDAACPVARDRAYGTDPERALPSLQGSRSPGGEFCGTSSPNRSRRSSWTARKSLKMSAGTCRASAEANPRSFRCTRGRFRFSSTTEWRRRSTLLLNAKSGSNRAPT